MNLTSINQWYDDIRIEVPGIPGPVMRNRLVLAATEVCKRSMVSQAELEPIDIEAGRAVYELPTISSCLRIWRVLWVRTPERILTQDTRRGLASRQVDWEKSTGEQATAFVNIEADTIRLVPAPTIEIPNGFTPYVAFIPDPRTKRLDDRLYFYYKEAIITGALAKLQRMTNTPWYDRQAAMDREDEFQVELTKIIANTYKDAGVADLRVAMRKF